MYTSYHQLSFHRNGKLTCYMGSHSVTCHPAEVWIPPLPQPKQVLDLATTEGCKAQLTFYVKADRLGFEHATCQSQVPTPYRSVNTQQMWFFGSHNFDCWLAAWRRGRPNGVGRINEVTLRRSRIVLGWVTCPGSTPGGGTLFRYVISQPGQLSLSSFRGR